MRHSRNLSYMVKYLNKRKSICPHIHPSSVPFAFIRAHSLRMRKGWNRTSEGGDQLY